MRASRFAKKVPIASFSGSPGTAISASLRALMSRFPMAPLPPATFVVRNLRYQPDPIDPHRNSECSEEAANIKPPCTVFPFRPLITARFPTKRGEPLAAVIKISPSCTKSIFVAFSSTNTSSSLKTNRSWLMLAERSTRIPLAQSVISAGVYVRPRLIVAMSSNLRCSQASMTKAGSVSRPQAIT